MMASRAPEVGSRQADRTATQTTPRGHTMQSRQTMSVWPGWISLLWLAGAVLAAASTPAQSGPGKPTLAEQRTARALEAVRDNPPALRAFLFGMPKGADLHNHLS